MPGNTQRRLAAILSADVAGYSRLMAEDEQGTIQTLNAYREAIGTLVEQHHGRVVDSPGDNLLAEFPNALDAVQCAVEIQGVLRVRNQSLAENRRMLFRIGVHLGDITAEGERIYGDGVNIASRLEGLAEPAGICISRTVHEQVESRLDLAFEDLGEQSVKNIPSPVGVFRVRIDIEKAKSTIEQRRDPRAILAAGLLIVLAVGAWWFWSTNAGRGPEAIPGEEASTVPGLGGAPAIAVLRFCNLSGDPEQEYFADGIAEDLITRLSRLRAIPVIARNSTFTFNGCSADVKQVSSELEARYIVEGSVRKGGDRVRISAQLIDGTTGHHVWAETYDRELQDIFAVQDEITESIVGSLSPELARSEHERAARQESRDLGAYDLAMRGGWHFFKFSKEDNAKARALFERAIELDPSLAPVWSGLSATHYVDLTYQWTDDPARSLEEQERSARRCVALDSESAECSLALANLFGARGQTSEQLAAFERAVELDPSFAVAHGFLGGQLAGMGRPEEAIAHLEKALRLDPRSPQKALWLTHMSVAHFAAGRYEDAVDWAKQSFRVNPDSGDLALAASYAQLGRIDEARAALAEVLRVDPDLTLGKLRDRLSPTTDPDPLEPFLDALRKAGLPE